MVLLLQFHQLARQQDDERGGHRDPGRRVDGRRDRLAEVVLGMPGLEVGPGPAGVSAAARRVAAG